MSYTEVCFTVQPREIGQQILIAQLGELDFESFSEEGNVLKAYIKTELFNVDDIKDCQIFENEDFSITFTSKALPEQNWNQTWEDNFKPVLISEQCVIRAPFHDAFNVDYEIVIEPKMSFGTGHHATTHMMMLALLEENLTQRKVLDMGCGTGVLAILAEMRGANHICAIDYDQWCFENTSENIERNNCSYIIPRLGSAELIEEDFDVILANINRNILLDHIPVYAKHLQSDGLLFLSGFYKEDLDLINKVAARHDLKFVKHQLKNNWICSKYMKL